MLLEDWQRKLREEHEAIRQMEAAVRIMRRSSTEKSAVLYLCGIGFNAQSRVIGVDQAGIRERVHRRYPRIWACLFMKEVVPCEGTVPHPELRRQ